MSFDGGAIYFTEQGLMPQQRPQIEEEGLSLQPIEAEMNGSYIFRDQLLQNAHKKEYKLTVNLEDIANYDTRLGDCLRTRPTDYVPPLENAIKRVFAEIGRRSDAPTEGQMVTEEEEMGASMKAENLPDFQLCLNTKELPISLRELTAEKANKIVVIPGIIVSAAKTNVKATQILVKCSNCGHEKKINLPPGFNGISVPRSCDNSKNPGADKQACKLDTYRTVSEKCRYVDQQVLKLQEMPENIPTGDMPRTFLLYVSRYLTDKVNPGSRVKIIGVLSVFNRGGGQASSNQQIKSNLRQAYVRVLGIQSDVYGQGSHSGFALPTISQTDEEKIMNMSKQSDIFNKISKSIAPSIYGHPDIKKSIACLLFGGSPKRLADGMKLRGDINVLLLGDPSTAKSQFLKFVERAAPISVYTSGKGSSAAGLTASVIKDGQSGEFQLEGGAMVLADGGVVCIDEFDKMRAQDRVAIHEAMEQQTISIAKAGITTVLNSRTSVLAAANPLAGRYDDLKHAAEQIDFQSAILSRFDCIFIVKDIREDANDKRIASHILDLHMNQKAGEQAEGEIPLDELKKYITYSKTRIRPRLSEEAAHQLQDLYVNDRQASKDQKLNAKNTGIPITVRQLEAIIRLSEAIAKIHLSGTVEISHVQEAHRLFKISTLNAAASGVGNASEAPVELQGMMKKVEEAIKRRVAIGTKISYQRLQAEMMQRFENAKAIEYALIGMVKREEFAHYEQRKILERKR